MEGFFQSTFPRASKTPFDIGWFIIKLRDVPTAFPRSSSLFPLNSSFHRTLNFPFFEFRNFATSAKAVQNLSLQSFTMMKVKNSHQPMAFLIKNRPKTSSKHHSSSSLFLSLGLLQVLRGLYLHFSLYSKLIGLSPH